ncbi:hypothetical protein ACIQ6K_30665 [Streptomyces sp. NPDC096354]|uniref:hypothetical protein n=1 Tax=Streptomyces sp. NPDC096354 TaxID=3366088 RepID=UPI0037F1C9FF
MPGIADTDGEVAISEDRNLRGGRAQVCCDLAEPLGAEWAAATAERKVRRVPDVRFLAFREQPHVTGVLIPYRRDGSGRPGLGGLGGVHHGHLPLRAVPDAAGSVAQCNGPAPPLARHRTRIHAASP